MESDSRTSLQVPPTSFVQNGTENAAFFEHKNQTDNKSAANSAEVKKRSAYNPLIYVPHWITGGAKHPGLIVETPGLANVAPPPITYRPHLPQHLSENNLISAFQIERIIYESLSKVLKIFPPLDLLKSDDKPVYEPNTTLSNDNHTPVRLPEWLIEPNAEEIERIIVRN